jgi:hypothetical protein
MDELEERRRKIREKIKRRSSPELFGIVLVGLIFAFLLFTSLPGEEKAEQAPATPAPEKAGVEQKTVQQMPPPAQKPAEQAAQEKESPEKTAPSGNVPPPRIVLSEPENTTYTTSLPPVKFRVYGPYLDTILLSIDDGENISIPHDGYIAEVEASSTFEMLNESFEEDNSLSAWSAPKRGYTISIDSESYDGKRSLKVTTTRTSKDWSWISREMDVIPGAKYRIVTHVKAENVKGLHIAIDAFDGSKWFRLTNVPSGTDGTFDWREFSATVNIPNNVRKIKIHLNHGWSLDGSNPATAWFDGIEIHPLTRVQTLNEKKILLLQNFSNGLHNLTLFANNTLANATSRTIYFTINATSEEKEKTYTIGDTSRAGSLEVTLKRFYGMVDVEIVKNTLSETYARVDIEVKNIGNKEAKLQFTPYNPVLIDNEGNTYDYTYVKIKDAAGRWGTHPDQLKLDVLYPGATRKGAIFFKPDVSIKAKNLTLVIYLNGEKYEFKFKRW